MEALDGAAMGEGWAAIASRATAASCLCLLKTFSRASQVAGEVEVRLLSTQAHSGQMRPSKEKKERYRG